VSAPKAESTPPKGATRTYELLARRELDYLEPSACLLCGAKDGRELVDDPPFRVFLCEPCGLAFTSPRIRADRLPELYNKGYFSSESAGDFGYASYADDREGFTKTFRLKAEALRRHVSGGRLLEIGCAAGFFLDATRRLGFDVYGTEIAEDMAAHAKDVLGAPNVYVGPLETYEPPKEPFDVVAMFDVVEHIADPIAALAKIRGALAPNGVLILQTQDVASITRRLMGRKWTHFKQLEHVWHFSDRSLRALLSRAGFDVVDIGKSGAGKYVSIGFVIDRMERFHPWLHRFARAFSALRKRYVYVNPWDELLVVARRRP
jgi:SAM-dependent methyltransferase